MGAFSDDTLATVALMALIGIALCTVWWAVTAKQIYINRKRGDKFRISIMRHALSILSDPRSTQVEKEVAATWLAYIHEPNILKREATKLRSTELRPSDWVERFCGKYTQIIHDGFRHLAVLAMLEHRRVGVAVRTLLANGAPDDVLARMSLGSDMWARLGLPRAQPPMPPSGRWDAHQRDAHWMRSSLELVKHVEPGKTVVRFLQQNAAQTDAEALQRVPSPRG